MHQLPIFPNPVRLRVLSADDSSAVRRLHCKLYDQCLDHAYACNWPGFGCISCTAYIPISIIEARADACAIADLLVAVRAQGPFLTSMLDYNAEDKA